MKYLLIGILSFNSVAFGQVLNTEALYSETNHPGLCSFDDCYDLKTVTEKVEKVSFDSQEGLLDLFEARQSIKIRTGQLLPSFSLRISSPLDMFDYIPNLVGFIFPSNWFRLKESKLHAKAQEHSYISLVANQKSMGKGLYLSTHKELINLKTLEGHILFTEQLLELMNKRFEQGEVAYEDLSELKAFYSLMRADQVGLASFLEQSSAELAYLLADVSNERTVGPVEIFLPDLRDEQKIRAKDYSEIILQASPELKALLYLSAAAKYSKRARAYEFLTPDSGTENAFGFGYLANIRIGLSEIEKLNIKKRAYETNLKKTLNVLVTQINTAIEIHQHISSVEESLKYILDSLLSDFDVSSKLDINRYISVLRENLENQQMKYNARHSYLMAKTQLERLLLNGPEYSDIASLIPTNTSSLDCYLRKENKMIKAALSTGELNLPEEIKFEDKELSYCIR